MTEEQIKKGFWYFDKSNNFPPKAIRTIEEYSGQDHLSLSFDISKDLKKWLKFLPTLEKVKFLWTYLNVNQELFDTICKMTNLVGLNIEKTSVKNINNLRDLKNIEYLSFKNCTKIESITALGSATTLKVLEIENAKKISNFDVVGQLINLQGLSISGGMWTPQNIDSLKSFSTLRKLKYLMIINTKMKDKNFDPLLALINLHTFNSSFNYPQKEFEKLKSLKNLKNSNLSYCVE